MKMYAKRAVLFSAICEKKTEVSICPQVKVTRGHVVTQIGRVTYQSMCLAKRNTAGPTPPSYFCSIRS